MTQPEPDETHGVGGGDGNGTPPQLVDDVRAVVGGGGNALQPAQPAASNMQQIHKRRVNTKVTHLNNFIESTSK